MWILARVLFFGLSSPFLGAQTDVAPQAPATTTSAGTPPTRPTSQGRDDTVELDKYVVTGRVGIDLRTKVDTSYSITDFTSDYLRRESPMGVPDMLRNVPGFWVEASGGEASANIRARGIPLEGYASIGMEEDGLPIQHDAGLGWMNADQSFRLDETVQRVEVVRGGPAAIFTSNAIGGVVNFITRRGGDTPEAVLKLETSDFARRRVDLWYGAPAGDWRYGFGGFYRIERGPRDPGFDGSKGGQWRFSLERKFERGRIEFSFRRLDDRVIFYLGAPLTFNSKGKTAGVPGFDPNYDTFSGPETEHMTFRTANGNRTINLPDGTRARLSQGTVTFEYDLGADWHLRDALRGRTSKSARTGLFPNSPLTAAATRLAQLSGPTLAAFPTATSVAFRFVNAPNEPFDLANVNGNGLVDDESIREINVTLDELLNDLRFMRKFKPGSQTHDVSLGYYYANTHETFKRYSANVLTDVRGHARLVDVVALDANGQVVGHGTENGVTRYGTEFANGDGRSITNALYASDEWQLSPHIRFDVGTRYERVGLSGSVERTASRNLGILPTTVDDNVLTGAGIFDTFDRTFGRFSWTAGANYMFTPKMGVFARFTPARRIPGAGDLIGNATAQPIVQKTDLGEVGYKYTSHAFDLFATAFYTKYHNLGFGELVFNPTTGNYDSRTTYANTRTPGLELESTVRPLKWFDVALSATWQDARFADFRYVSSVTNGQPVYTDLSGHRLVRVPRLSYRITPGVSLLNNALRVHVSYEYYGDRYADVANSQKLPAYDVVNLRLSYQFTRQISMNLSADNLFNTIGLTEGNPRAGVFQSGDAGARYYIARPIFGRNYRASVTWRM